MLLRKANVVERCCPRRWLLLACCGLLALAVLIGGARLHVVGAQASGSKEEPKKETPKKAPAAFPEIDDLMNRLPPGLDPALEKQLRKHLEEMTKRVDQINKRRARAGLRPLPNVRRLLTLPGAGGLPGLQGLPGGAWIGPLGGVGRPGADQAGMEETRLGAQLEQPSATLVDQLDLPRGQGLVVRELGPNSAGAKAGLKANDILLELAGKAVPSTWEEFRDLLKGIKPNTPVDAVVMRKGRKETLKGLSLPEAQEQPARPGPKGAVKPALKRGYLGVQIGTQGANVIVMRVIAGGPAHDADVRAGDVLVSIDGVRPSSVVTAVRMIQGLKPKQKVKMVVKRGGADRELEVTLGGF